MALPDGVDKATGLRAALEVLGLEPDQVAGIGNAENDVALLASCGFGVAIAMSVPGLKECADFVTRGGAGRGVVELARQMLADDLESWRRPGVRPAS